MRRPLRIAGLVSGGGRTLLNLLDHAESGDLPIEVVQAIASRPECTAVERLRERGVPVEVVARHDFRDETAMHDRIDALLALAEADLVCLCGYLRRFRVNDGHGHDWTGRVVNIHPAILPEFGGLGMFGHRVHQAVLDAGRTESGCTVHFVDAIYDHGPIILQRTCPVLPGDTAETLAARVFAEERIAYPEALGLIAEGRIRLEDGRIVDATAPDFADE